MRVYHFAPSHLIDSIRRDGITLGKTPVRSDDGIVFLEPTQWLSSNPDFDAQEWNGRVLIQYDRAAYRIEVSIPKSARSKLLTWPEFKKHIAPVMLPGFDDYPSAVDWLIFMGKIPAGWLRGCTSRPVAWLDVDAFKVRRAGTH